jgi:hypothetical protein
MTSPPFDDVQKRFSDFAQKDYELKVTYLTNHFHRMWTRFNYFVVVEAALLSGKTIFGDMQIGTTGLGFGLGLSLVWYVMGAEDRYVVQVYREQVKQAATVLSSPLWPAGAAPYQYVGDLENVKIKRRLSAWRFNRISATRLAALIPLAVTMLWLALLIRTLMAG